MTNVFISYRHDDTAGHAGRLSDRLVARFGAERVFMDVQDIQPGENFVSAIDRTLDRCDCLLAVVGRRWIEDFAERQTHGDDFVRSEIGKALTRGITVIPVLVGGATMPSTDQLPAELAAFGRCQAVEVRDDRFNEDAALLVNFLAGRLAGSSPVSPEWPVSKRTLLLASAALFVVLTVLWFAWRRPAPAPAQLPASSPAAAPVRALPSLTYGEWTLRLARDDDGRNWSNSVLQFTAQEEAADGLVVHGQFTWRLDNVLVGTEDVSGRYVERTRQVILGGNRVTDAPHRGPNRLAVGSYSAILGDDERALLKGRWGSTGAGEPGSTGAWEAVR